MEFTSVHARRSARSLRNNDPPFSETELANEEAALDAAIHLVEVGGEIRQGAGDEACFAPETEVSFAEPTLNPAVPTANPTLMTIACESADYRYDEGLVQLDLVRSGRPVPVTGGAAS